MSRWIWRVTNRYNDTVEAPRRKGDIATQTVHASNASLLMEVRASVSRGDVATDIEWVGSGPSHPLPTRVAEMLMDQS